MIFYSKTTDSYGNRCKLGDDTKVYQNLWINDILGQLVQPGMRILEIGANDAFGNLKGCLRCELWAADPYQGAGGGMLTPPTVPGVLISQCEIGITSNALPNNFFDIVFSSSVLEHVGQRECFYDCHPVNPSPAVQELPRNLLCKEIYRFLKPGGFSIHSIDHAVRNVSFMNNFLGAGLKQWKESPIPSSEEMVSDKDAFTQTWDWHDSSKPISEPWLHPVICSVFVKPEQ